LASLVHAVLHVYVQVELLTALERRHKEWGDLGDRLALRVRDHVVLDLDAAQRA